MSDAPVVGGTPEDESLRVAHARKQGHADGFQAGWHAALFRVREGDRVDELAALVPRPEPRELEPQSCPKCGDTTADRVVRCGMCGWTWDAAVRPASAPSLEPSFPKGHPALCYELCDPTFEVAPHIHTPKGVYVVEVEP